MNTLAFSPDFNAAIYEFCPSYGWHVLRRSQTNDSIPLVLPEQIRLQEPIKRDPLRPSQTGATARNEQRGCLWWVEWHPTSLPTINYSKLVTPKGSFLLVWQQPEPGLYNPFRLLVAEVTADFPKPGQRWKTAAKAIAHQSTIVHLPKLARVRPCLIVMYDND